MLIVKEAGVNITVPVEVLDSVTVRFASAVFGLPFASCRCTVIVDEATPAVTVTGAEVITSLLATPGLTENVPLTPVLPVPAWSVAVIVASVPDLLNVAL